MAEGWTVLVFGDSWAKYMWPCWPSRLAERLNARNFNFAESGSRSTQLLAQLEHLLLNPEVPRTAEGQLAPRTLAVIHSGGNDLIGKLAPALLGGGGADPIALEAFRPNPGAAEVRTIREMMESLYASGVRHFLVSGVPLFSQMPMMKLASPLIQALVDGGQMEELGVTPGDSYQLALDVQGIALSERWAEMLKEFQEQHPGSKAVFFDEVGALGELRSKLGEQAFDTQMWDMSMFHPSIFGHEQLAQQAHRCVESTIQAAPTVMCH